MSYKNALASRLAQFGNSGGKYVKIALDGERLLLLGMQKGLTLVVEKVGAIADQIDFVIDKVELVRDTCIAFADAGDFVPKIYDLLFTQVDRVVELVENNEHVITAEAKFLEFQRTLIDWGARVETVSKIVSCEAHDENNMPDWTGKLHEAIAAADALDHLDASFQTASDGFENEANLRHGMAKLERSRDTLPQVAAGLSSHRLCTRTLMLHSEDQAHTVQRLPTQSLSLQELQHILSALMVHARDPMLGLPLTGSVQQLLGSLTNERVDGILNGLTVLKTSIGPRLRAIDAYKTSIASLRRDRVEIRDIFEQLNVLSMNATSARNNLPLLRASIEKLTLAAQQTTVMLEIATQLEVNLHATMLPAVFDAKDAVDAFLGPDFAAAFSEDVGAMFGVVLNSINMTRSGHLLDGLQSRRRQRRVLQHTGSSSTNQVDRLSTSVQGAQDLTNALADHAIAAVVPLINAAMTNIDQINEFLQSEVTPKAEMARDQLPALKDDMDEFKFYFDLFVGMVRDILGTAKKAVQNDPELAGMAEDVQAFADQIIPVTEQWASKVDDWMKTADGVLAMVEEMDAAKVFELISKLLEQLNLPGEKIFTGMSELITMVQAMQTIIDDPDGGQSSEKLLELGRLLAIPADRIKSGNSDSVLSSIGSAVSRVQAAASSAVPAELFSAFRTAHSDLCDADARSLLLCGDADVAPSGQSQSIAQMFLQGAEILAIVNHTRSVGSDVDNLAVAGSIMGAVVDTYLDGTADGHASSDNCADATGVRKLVCGTVETVEFISDDAVVSMLVPLLLQTRREILSLRKTPREESVPVNHSILESNSSDILNVSNGVTFSDLKNLMFSVAESVLDIQEDDNTVTAAARLVALIHDTVHDVHNGSVARRDRCPLRATSAMDTLCLVEKSIVAVEMTAPGGAFWSTLEQINAYLTKAEVLTETNITMGRLMGFAMSTAEALETKLVQTLGDSNSDIPAELLGIAIDASLAVAANSSAGYPADRSKRVALGLMVTVNDLARALSQFDAAECSNALQNEDWNGGTMMSWLVRTLLNMHRALDGGVFAFDGSLGSTADLFYAVGTAIGQASTHPARNRVVSTAYVLGATLDAARGSNATSGALLVEVAGLLVQLMELSEDDLKPVVQIFRALSIDPSDLEALDLAGINHVSRLVAVVESLPSMVSLSDDPIMAVAVAVDAVHSTPFSAQTMLTVMNQVIEKHSEIVATARFLSVAYQTLFSARCSGTIASDICSRGAVQTSEHSNMADIIEMTKHLGRLIIETSSPATMWSGAEVVAAAFDAVSNDSVTTNLLHVMKVVNSTLDEGTVSMLRVLHRVSCCRRDCPSLYIDHPASTSELVAAAVRTGQEASTSMVLMGHADALTAMMHLISVVVDEAANSTAARTLFGAAHSSSSDINWATEIEDLSLLVQAFGLMAEQLGGSGFTESSFDTAAAALSATAHLALAKVLPGAANTQKPWRSPADYSVLLHLAEVVAIVVGAVEHNVQGRDHLAVIGDAYRAYHGLSSVHVLPALISLDSELSTGSDREWTVESIEDLFDLLQHISSVVEGRLLQTGDAEQQTMATAAVVTAAFDVAIAASDGVPSSGTSQVMDLLTLAQHSTSQSSEFLTPLFVDVHNSLVANNSRRTSSSNITSADDLVDLLQQIRIYLAVDSAATAGDLNAERASLIALASAADFRGAGTVRSTVSLVHRLQQTERILHTVTYSWLVDMMDQFVVHDQQPAHSTDPEFSNSTDRAPQMRVTSLLSFLWAHRDLFVAQQNRDSHDVGTALEYVQLVVPILDLLSPMCTATHEPTGLTDLIPFVERILQAAGAANKILPSLFMIRDALQAFYGLDMQVDIVHTSTNRSGTPTSNSSVDTVSISLIEEIKYYSTLMFSPNQELAGTVLQLIKMIELATGVVSPSSMNLTKTSCCEMAFEISDLVVELMHKEESIASQMYPLLYRSLSSIHSTVEGLPAEPTAQAKAPVSVDDVINLSKSLSASVAEIAALAMDDRPRAVLAVCRLVAESIDSSSSSVSEGDRGTTVQLVELIEQAMDVIEAAKDDGTFDLILQVRDAVVAGNDQASQPVPTTNADLTVEDVVFAINDIAGAFSDVLSAGSDEARTRGLSHFIARIIDSVSEYEENRMDAAVTAAFTARDMITNGASAGGVLVVLNQVMIALTGEPMTAANNPIAKWMREALTALLQSTLDIGTDSSPTTSGSNSDGTRSDAGTGGLARVPSELETLARVASDVLRSSPNLTKLIDYTPQSLRLQQWLVSELSIVEDRTAQLPHRQLSDVTASVSSTLETIDTILSFDDTHGVSSMLSRRSHYTSEFELSIDSVCGALTNLRERYLVDDSSLKSLFLAVPGPKSLDVLLTLADDIEQLIPLLNNSRNEFLAVHAEIQQVDRVPFSSLMESASYGRSQSGWVDALDEITLSAGEAFVATNPREQLERTHTAVRTLVTMRRESFSSLVDTIGPLNDAWSSECSPNDGSQPATGLQHLRAQLPKVVKAQKDMQSLIQVPTPHNMRNICMNIHITILHTNVKDVLYGAGSSRTVRHGRHGEELYRRVKHCPRGRCVCWCYHQQPARLDRT